MHVNAVSGALRRRTAHLAQISVRRAAARVLVASLAVTPLAITAEFTHGPAPAAQAAVKPDAFTVQIIAGTLINYWSQMGWPARSGGAQFTTPRGIANGGANYADADRQLRGFLGSLTGRAVNTYTFREYDAHARTFGAQRDGSRIVQNLDTGALFLTNDHYRSFLMVGPGNTSPAFRAWVSCYSVPGAGQRDRFRLTLQSVTPVTSPGAGFRPVTGYNVTYSLQPQNRSDPFAAWMNVGPARTVGAGVSPGTAGWTARSLDAICRLLAPGHNFGDI